MTMVTIIYNLQLKLTTQYTETCDMHVMHAHMSNVQRGKGMETLRKWYITGDIVWTML